MAQMLMMWTLRSSAGSVEYFSLTLIAAARAPAPPGGAPSPSTAPAASESGHGSVRGGRARSKGAGPPAPPATPGASSSAPRAPTLPRPPHPGRLCLKERYKRSAPARGRGGGRWSHFP